MYFEMARARNPNRDKAYQIWLKHQGNVTNRKIAEILDEDEKVVAVWKQRDKWNVVQQSDESCTTLKKNKGGAPRNNRNALKNQGGAKKGNANAKGNRGGSPPKGNDNAVTHGFFRKHFPEDVADLAAEIMEKNPIDMLWENITIQYTAIIRAQRLMFVKDQEDITKEVKKEKSSESSDEIEYEIQFAWDKHATFLNAQSRAMSTLSSLIRDFDKLANIDDERRLKLEGMKLNVKKVEAEVKKLSGSGNDKPIEIIVKRKGDD